MNSDASRTGEIEKYKELYGLSKEAFKDEDDRFNRIDDKASKYIPALVFLFGLEGFFANWVLSHLIPPESAIDQMGIAFIALAFLSLLIGWVQLLRALRSQTVRLLRPDQDDVAFFDNHDLRDVYRGYAIRFNQERELNTNITNKKVQKLRCVYETMLASAFFLGLAGLVYAAHFCVENLAKVE